MTGESIILYYNRLNGKSARVSTLKALHRRAQNFLDSVGSGPYVSDIRGIYNRLAKAIKVNKGKDDLLFDRLVLTPIKLKEKKAVPEKRPEKQFEGVSEDLLYGLELLPKEAEGLALEGIGDTTYQVITDKILELIKNDGLIWRKPWNSKTGNKDDLAKNHVTKHVYRGANFYLNYLLLSDYTSSSFFTFKQVTELGGKVRKGQQGWPVVYFKWLYKDLAASKLVDERIATDANGKLKQGYVKIPAMFYYVVFNAEQCEGLKIKFKKSKARTSKERIESAEQILEEMPKRPKIKSGPEAWYRRDLDLVQLVPLDQFEVDQHYYSVAFHELIHSTGHPNRVGRDREQGRRFGDKKYAFEELIAELGASYLCGESGILYFTLNNSAAYIKNWSSALREEMTKDPKFFLKAASAAQKAADFMLARGEFHDLKKIKAEKKVKSEEAETKPKKTDERTESSAEPILAGPASRKKKSNIDGLIAGSAIAGLQFKRLDLTGRYKTDFHRIYNDTQMMVWGAPGSGKTVYLLQFAQYLASTLGLKVLYIAQEELNRSSFTEKIQKFSIDHANLKFTKNFDSLDRAGASVDDFDAVFIDSINSIGMSLKDYKEFADAHPNLIKVLIVQSTKDEDFRGGKDWEHEMDIAGEIRDRKLVLRKNRLDDDFEKKRRKLLQDEQVKVQTERKIIKEKVSQAVPETKVDSKPV